MEAMLTEGQITFWISVVLFIFSAFNFYKTRAKDMKSDNEAVIKSNIKLDNLCSNMNETRVDLKGLIDSTRRINEEQIRLSQEVKAMWKRIDEHTARLNLLYQHVDVYGVADNKEDK